MLGPFPGMDPYLEEVSDWPEVEITAPMKYDVAEKENALPLLGA